MSIGPECAPLLTMLYVPGDRPERFDKAVHSCADGVIIDLEDAVAAAHKDRARHAAVDYAAQHPDSRVTIRINGSDTPWQAADLDALSECTALAAVRVPKVESASDVARISGSTPDVPVQAVVETARGVENLITIAEAPATRSISLGEADLRSQLRITAPDGLDWIRARLVVAAAAAGLAPPMMSVWTDLNDLAGLAASCQDGRARGFLGRTAIHPKQLPVIRDAFLPTDTEIARAREILDALDADPHGGGVGVLASGGMVDEAMRLGAERTIALASMYAI